MHRLLLILLIALLPLRSWVGNGMAVDMLTKVISSKVIANYSYSARDISLFDVKGDLKMATTMPPDCPMLTPVGTAAKTAETTLCHGCDTCTLCSVVCDTTTALPLLARMTPAKQHVAPPAAFASAERSNSFKPPIA